MELLKLIQSAIDKAAETTGFGFGMTDSSGLILACSDKKKNGMMDDGAREFISQNLHAMDLHERRYRRMVIKNHLENVVFIRSTGETAEKCLDVLTAGIESIRMGFDEKGDKQVLIRGILLDNILPGDVMLRCRELHIPMEGQRAVILVRTAKPAGTGVLEVLQSMFPSKNRDFIVLIDDLDTVLVKELKNRTDRGELEQLCSMIADTVSSELMTKVVVGLGGLTDNIRDIARSCKEAQMAITIGSIFDGEQTVLDYNKLGIGRLIYQLPIKMCHLFLNEVFKGGEAYIFQTEILNSIQQFFDSDFNVSEAAKQLYVHRNTLVYRLDKIERDLGLNLRKFNDAMVLRIAVMVKKYLNSLENEGRI
ncbi:MAG TPA: CdaR family transcriptional regulator [Clostridiales bacterium]|nr:CdaR family transcriptional regulator [Clostridiales bacterium]